MPIPLQVALISALVSIFLFYLKDRFDRKSRREQWQQNRDEWMLEKEARDIEEIVATLSNFLKAFSDASSDMELEQWSLVLELSALRRAQVEALVTNNSDSLNFLQARFFNEAREFISGYSQRSEHLAKIVGETSAWFRFDVVRLSVWFDEANYDKEALTSIGKKIQNCHFRITNEFFKFSIFADQTIRDVSDVSSLEVTAYDIQKTEEHERKIKAALLDWSNLIEETVSFQKTLINRFRPSKVEVIHTFTNDGLLVWLARWIEKSLRLLLNLG